MRKVITVISLMLIIACLGFAQEIKKNQSSQLLKEDSNNSYKSDKITDLDLIQALEIAGIRIHKFDLGQFDTTYNLLMFADEYVGGKIVKTDTIFSGNNIYSFYEKGSKDYFLDYIDQIKIFTKDEENKTSLYIETYGMGIKNEIAFEKTDKKQFFQWRNYLNTTWKLNKKIPLMVFASSWEDKKYGFQRFCGVVNLIENEKGTNELLSSSPHYFSVSYLVTEIKE
jgi:hypothetical protein